MTLRNSVIDVKEHGGDYSVKLSQKTMMKNKLMVLSHNTREIHLMKNIVTFIYSEYIYYIVVLLSSTTIIKVKQ